MNTTLISTFGAYLCKVTLLSGILYGYYHFSLKDKQIFGWNRFYLLTCAVLSVMIPLFNIPLHWVGRQSDSPVLVHLLRVVPGAGEWAKEGAENVHQATDQFPWATAFVLVYVCVAVILMVLFGRQVWRLTRLKQQSPQQTMESATLIDTDIPGAPFSFFRWIFWDARLPLDSTEGQHILRHEMAHVLHWHSLDKLAMQLLCIVFFPVIPLYWLRRELQLIHEYQADREAADSSEIPTYAAFLVHHALHTPAWSLSNGFYQHPLHKRIAMMMFFLPTRKSTLRKWVALPLVLFLFGLFAFTLKQKNALADVTVLGPSRVINLIVNPGHGGLDNGARYNGLTEKDVTLSIGREVALLAPQYKVNVILTRNKDTYTPVSQVAEFDNRQHADLMVSIHANAAFQPAQDGKGETDVPNTRMSGMETYISPQNPHYDSCVVLGSIMQEHLGKVYPSVSQVMQRTEGIRVLGDANCPAVLIECGYLTNPKDAAFLSDKNSKEKIARQILESVVAYSGGANLTYPVNHNPGH